MKKTVIALSIAAAYGGLSQASCVIGVPGLVRWRWLSEHRDASAADMWTDFIKFGDTP